VLAVRVDFDPARYEAGDVLDELRRLDLHVMLSFGLLDAVEDEATGFYVEDLYFPGVRFRDLRASHVEDAPDGTVRARWRLDGPPSLAGAKGRARRALVERCAEAFARWLGGRAVGAERVEASAGEAIYRLEDLAAELGLTPAS
jgi:hypothetical protein